MPVYSYRHNTGITSTIFATPAQPQPSRDVAKIVGIFQELKAALPETQEATIRALRQ